MITTENFIGNPGDNTLYGNTLQLYEQRIQMYPDTVVTDLGFRSKDNFKSTPAEGQRSAVTAKEIESVFLGNSGDVVEQKKDFCRKARSATEGFIAVAKNLRGFSKSLYRRFYGDKIWTLLCQTAYNLRKFLQLYQNGEIKEQSQIHLGLLA